MRFLLLLCLTVGVSHSFIDFTNSAIYDIHDFKGVDEVHIPKCDAGCLIFAATMGEGFSQYPENLDPYAMNIHVVDNDSGNKISISKLAQQRDKSNKKIPMTITGQGNISVVNVNVHEDDWSAWTIILYVVDKATADKISYEVYDYSYTENTKIVPQSDVVTIMSAYNFRVKADPNDLPNSVTARLAGFDNALDTNSDGCPFAYKTPETTTFPGFTIMSNSPVVSLAIGKKNNPIVLQPDLQFNTVRDFVPNGFFSSPGWNGCTKQKNGGLQYFRYSEQLYTDVDLLINNNDDNVKVSMEILPNFDAKHNLIIQEVGTTALPKIVTGTDPKTLNFPSTHYLTIDFQNMRGDQGFLLRYTSEIIPKPTTIVSSTETTTSTTTFAPQTSPTTSSGFRTAGCMLSLFLISLLF